MAKRPAADPMLAIASQIAGTLIDPQTAAINREAARKEAALAASRTGYTNLIDAVNRLTGGIPTTIQNAYQQAADRTAGYASSLTGKLGADAQASAAEVAQHLAGLKAPGAVTSALPDALNVANYVGGTLPASSLAAEAASRLTAAQMARTGTGAALGAQALGALKASQQEIDELRAKGLDLANTRPGEIQKALIQLRAEKRADAELQMSAQRLSLEQWQALQSQATVLTNMTGQLYAVKNGKVVPTGMAAPGSDAASAAASAGATPQIIGSSESGYYLVDPSTGQLKPLTKPTGTPLGGGSSLQHTTLANGQDAIFNPNTGQITPIGKPPVKTKRADGLSNSDVRQFGESASRTVRAAFFGVRNSNFDSSKPGGPGEKPNPNNPYYSVPPISAAEAMQAMRAAKIPYDIAWNAIYQYAARKNSPWADALVWHAPSKRYPKATGGKRK